MKTAERDLIISNLPSWTLSKQDGAGKTWTNRLSCNSYSQLYWPYPPSSWPWRLVDLVLLLPPAAPCGVSPERPPGVGHTSPSTPRITPALSEPPIQKKCSYERRGLSSEGQISGFDPLRAELKGLSMEGVSHQGGHIRGGQLYCTCSAVEASVDVFCFLNFSFRLETSA